MIASEDDLKYFDENGFNTSLIMKEAHRMVQAEGVRSYPGAKSYAEKLSEKMSRKWSDAKEAKKRVKQSGGPEAVRQKAEAGGKADRRGEAREEIKSRGEKKRTKILAEQKSMYREQVQEDEDKTFDGFGKTWTASTDSHAMGGPQGGQRVCYAYYYEA